MRLIDADKIPEVSWDKFEEEAFRQTIAEQPTMEAIPTDWIIAYIKAKMDKVADMVKADGNEHEIGMEIVEATAINKMLTDWEERKAHETD